MEKKRTMRTICRLIDCGHVNELSEEEKKRARDLLSVALVHNHHSGECIVKVDRLTWTLHRRLALLEGTPPSSFKICVKLRYRTTEWHAIPAGGVDIYNLWYLDLHKFRGVWRLAWIDDCGVENVIWDFDSYDEAVEWLRSHIIVADVDGEYEGDVFELLLQAVQSYI
jgi:hypothetical protein